MRPPNTPSQSDHSHSQFSSVSPSPTTEQGSRTTPLRTRSVQPSRVSLFSEASGTSPESMNTVDSILQELDQEDCDSDFDFSDE